MKTLIVYDSLYGNTGKVADAIGTAIGEDVHVVHANQVDSHSLGELDLLIVGSPTHGSMPSEAIQAFLSTMDAPGKQTARALAFDTRLTWKFLDKFGGAADKIADALKVKGWQLALPPEGFLVGELRRGPLKYGELERAASWAKQLKE